MQLVCRENNRVENLPGSNNERGEGWLGSTDDRRKRRQRCTCKLKHNNTYTEIRPNSAWKIVFERECINHYRTCPMFASSASTTTAKIRIKTCGAFLAGAIGASINIIRGAGGSSISPVLQCARVVPQDNSAFRLVRSIYPILNGREITSRSEVKAQLEINIHQLARTFRDGRASPYDVDLDGNTLLHVRVTLPRNKQSLTSTQAASQVWTHFLGNLKDELFESMMSSLIRLEELCVPPNWINDSSL